ncbi:MAG TPA: C13 family peptidase [Rudaea sp.]|nr:C13 family peptidase [Rudaea sp.]
MIRHRLPLTFLFAFSLGVIAAVYLVRHQQEPARDTVPGEAPTASAGPDAADKPGSADRDDSDDGGENEPAPWPDDAGTPEQVMYAQPARMDEAIAKLTPRTPGKVNLYLVAFAGDGNENVFRNEVEYVEKQFVERFDAGGHTLVLINNPATLAERPLATLSNLETAIDAVATKMKADEDVLLLFITSHGSAEHELAVDLDPLPLDPIVPEDLADVLAGSNIVNKVIVLSACYSGGFIDALKGPSTMIITAARADRPSFGCGTKSDITDFGRAFFVNGLNENDNFTAAFGDASKLISDWETKAGDEHSDPQLSTTPQIEAQLKRWRAGLHLGPPVPFQPAVPTRARPPAAESLTASVLPAH